jgi:ABC-2 type transport system ATP-binding protein
LGEGVGCALVVDGLSKRFRSRQALDGVSLKVGEGELVGLLGPNGAGKSTLVKSVCGLVRPTAGSITVLGDRAGSRAARARLGYLAETFRYPAWATGGEVLRLHQRLAGSSGGAPERRRILELVGLPEAEGLRVEAMSKGMQQRLGLAQALVGSPRLLLLDEPTSALDPMGRRLVRSVLEQVRADGVSVLLNSHLLSEVELVCDRVVILRRGTVVAEGRPADLERPQGVEVETSAGTRVIPGLTRDEVPGLVARLVGDGEQVYGVRPLRSTLEDVYLEAVEGDVS